MAKEKKPKLSSSQRKMKIAEDNGQMNIFDMLNSGIDPQEIVEKAENDIEDSLASKIDLSDSPVGLKTENTNMDIDDVLADENNLEQENLSSNDLEEKLKKIVNAEPLAEEETELVNESVEYTFYSLDDFAGSLPNDFEDRLVGFNTGKTTEDPRFVVVANKEDFESIQEFKHEFSDLDDSLIIAFPLKAEAEPENIVNLYEKKINKNRKISKKEADKEAKKIKALEDSGIVSEEMQDDEPEAPAKRGRKPKNK